jgi:GntR family transcriptional regulator/MocR family aminotransferase
VSFEVPKGGLAFWLIPINQKDLYKIKEQANNSLLNFYTPDRFSFAEPICGLRLGYASLSETNLEKGIEILGRCL